MATDLKAKLTLSAEATGGGELRAIGDALRTLGAAAGSAEPEFNAAADALDRVVDRAQLVDDFTAAERALAGLNQQAGASAGQFREQQAALDAARAALEAAGLSADHLSAAQTQVRAEAQAAAEGILRLAEGYRATGQAAQTAGREGAQSLEQIGASTGGLEAQFKRLTVAVGGLFAASKLKAFAQDAIRTADEFGQMAERIRMATRSTAEFDQVQQRLADTANATYRPLQEQQELYIRTADALRGMGESTEGVLDITDSLSALLTTNAASAEHAQAAITAYTKSIQSGRIDTQAWQSLLAATPTLVDAIARTTGMAADEVRRLGITGRLAVADLNAALRLTREENVEAVAGMATTVGDAMQRLANTWGEFLRQANESSGATQQLVALIDTLTDNLDTLVGVATKAGAVLLAVAGMKALSALRGYTAEVWRTAAGLDGLAAAGGRASVATRAAGAALAAFGTIAKGIVLVAIADNIMRVVDAMGQLHAAHRRLAQSQAQAAKMDEQVATRLRAISEATGVAVTSFEELDAAVEAGRIHMDEATGSWHAGAAAQAAVAEAAADARRALAEQNLGDVLAQYDALVEKSGSAADALAKLAGTLDVTSTDRVAAFSGALSELARTGKIGAEQVGEAWRAAIDKLDAKGLAALRTSFQEAVAQGIAGARQWADVNQQILARSFDLLGVSAAQALGTVGEKGQEAIDTIELMATSLEEAGASMEDTARALELAFEAAIPNAESLEAIDALQQRLQAMGEAGKIGAEGIARVEEALKRQRAAIEDQLPGIQSVAEALRNLGIKSDAELQGLADSARRAFEVVRDSGSASAREINAAWKAMAEAAIAANDGAADAAIQSAARMHGFVVETDKAGKAVIKSMQDAADATRDVGRAAGESAGAMQDMGDAAGQVTEAIQGTWLDAEAAASRYSSEAAKLAFETVAGWRAVGGAVGDAYGRMQKEMSELHARTVATLEELDQRQARLSSNGARGVEDLKLRLIELNGTEDEIAHARLARDQAEVERQRALLQLDLQRARVRGQDDEAARLEREIELLGEQLRLLDQVFNAEQKQRAAAERVERRGTAGGSAAPARDRPAGGVAAPAASGPVNITLNANGISDPQRLARLIEPELARLARLAR